MANRSRVENGINRKADRADSYEKTVQRKHGKKRMKPEYKARVFRLLLLLALSLLLFDLLLAAIYCLNQYDKIIPYQKIETGEKICLDDYIRPGFDFRDKIKCNMPFDIVDTTVPQHIEFKISLWKFKVPCVLDIVDTTPPTGEGIPQIFYLSTGKIPEASEVVQYVYDLSGDVTIEYYGEPQFKAGNTINYVSLTDPSGNQSIIEVPFIVTDDHTGPVIEGTKDITYWIGDSISYRDGVTVTDDYDKNPLLTIDKSQLDLTKIGTYPVIYIATDEAGNKTEVEITVTVKKHPKTYVDKETLYAAARKVLDKITTEDMTDMEKALNIFYWCRYNIHYINSTDTTSWTRAAYDALTKNQGTCYSYAYAAKALLHEAGIENMILKRSPYRYSKHYWNYIKIDGQWYHCDSTPRHTYRLYLFMYTDKELANFYVDNYNGYSYNHNGVPKSATKSVQNKIDYWGHKIKK